MHDDELGLLIMLALFAGVAVSAIPSNIGRIEASFLALTSLVMLVLRQTIRATLKTWIGNGHEAERR